MNRIKVNENQDGFELNGKPFFYLGDTVWSAFTNITLEEWAYYLKYRKAQGFNVLQINTMPQWDRCLADTGLYPFPMKTDQVFDYSEFNQEYYENAKKMCRMAVREGFQLALVVLWSNYIPGTWACTLTQANVMPLEFISRYTNKIIDEFEQFSPVYVISGDTDFNTEETIACYREALKVLNERTPDSLKTFHIKRGYDVIPEDFLGDIDFYMFQSGHNKTEQDKAYLLPEKFIAKYPKKPMINAEPCYEQMGYSRQLYGRFSEQDIRAAAWTSILSGAGAGVTYGAHGIWNWQKSDRPENPVSGEGFDEAFTWGDAIHFPGAWDYGFIKEFLLEQNIHSIQPAMELLGNHTEEIRVADIDDGRYLIYLPKNTNVILKKTFRNLNVRVIALDARRSACAEHIEKNGCTVIKMHPFYQDVLLLLSEDKDQAITTETTFDDLRAIQGIFSEYMQLIQPTDKGIPVRASIKDYCGFQSKETALALNMMKRQLEDGRGVLTNIYSEEERKKTEELRQTRLFLFPNEKNSPLAFIIPGGGYHKVCTMLEGIPTAWKLWSEGYSIAIVKYRVDQAGMMPKPVDDVAAALKWIRQHEETTGISLNNYIVVGFSAGGHLAGEWGTTANGYARYKLPKPKALILGYAAASVRLYEEQLKRADEPDEETSLAKEFMTKLIGENYNQRDVEQHSIDLLIDECFPPTYLIHSLDDPLVPFESSVCVDEKLSQYQIPHMFTRLKESGHGFGLWLNGTQETKDWMDQALAFIDGL